MRLRDHDDLRARIDGGHARVPLDYAFAGSHFRTLVIGAIALPYPACRPTPFLRMRGQPGPQFGGIVLESRDTRGGFGVQIGFHGQRIRGAVAREHRLGRNTN